MPGTKKYTDEMLLDELRRVAKRLDQGKHNIVPSTFFRQHSRIETTTVIRRFGSWNKAIEAAGLIPIPQNDGGKWGVIECEKTIRERVSAQTKVTVFQRDKHKCVLCGKSPAIDESIELHIDHIRPCKKGGKSTVNNLWVLCSKCNYAKGSKDTLPSLFAANYLATRYFEKVLKEKKTAKNAKPDNPVK